MAEFLELLQSQILLGDGAMGTLLYERGLPLDRSCEELVLSQPERIRKIHEEYIAAGAHVIETNSFGANRRKLSDHGLEDKTREINRRATALARDASKGKSVWVAGSVGPLGKALEEVHSLGLDPAAIFSEQIEGLLEGEPDLLLLETFSDLDELKIALGVASKLTQKPIGCSMSFTEEGLTYRGVTIQEAFMALKAGGAKILGANCCVGPRALSAIFRKLTLAKDVLYSAYPNAGRPEFFEGRYIYQTAPAYFADRSVEIARQGVRLLGGCCGTRPEHIAAMRKALSTAEVKTISVAAIGDRGIPTELSAARDHRARLQTQEEAEPQPTKALPPTLLDLIREKTLIVTEFDSPKTLLLDKMLEAARALKEAGTDFMTVADNSLAILRMNCVVASHLVEEQTGLQMIVHLACRDRNLIGTQSELMGMDALGLNHVLALTGDPSKVGDTPGATSVYDLNSISLLEGIRAMNGGKTFGGRDMKKATRFVSGCSFNPNVKNLDVQVKRLERKVAAGAQFVMTQPIFDPVQARLTYEATKSFGIPILVGVCPLLNTRNTEFLHNEVPGIVIPDKVRERMRGKEGEIGQAEGLAVAKELASEVLAYFKGIYLITPLVRYETTVALSAAIRSGSL